MTVSLAELEHEIEQVARPTSFADARRRLSAFAQRHGFDNVSLLAPARQTGEEADFVIVSTYPLEWLDHYVTNGFAAMDPLMIEARRQTAPFQLEPVRAATPGGRAILSALDLREHGREGVCIPIPAPFGGTSLFVVTSKRPAEAWREQCGRCLPLLQILGLELSRRLTGLSSTARRRERLTLLSGREREVLSWAAAGKTVWETGQLLGISEQTAQSYLRDAVRRLGCVNKTHAVAEAVRRALI